MNTEYSQGIASDEPVILRDGLPMTPDEIVETFNRFQRIINEQAKEREKMTKKLEVESEELRYAEIREAQRGL